MFCYLLAIIPNVRSWIVVEVVMRHGSFNQHWTFKIKFPQRRPSSIAGIIRASFELIYSNVNSSHQCFLDGGFVAGNPVIIALRWQDLTPTMKSPAISLDIVTLGVCAFRLTFKDGILPLISESQNRFLVWLILESDLCSSFLFSVCLILLGFSSFTSPVVTHSPTF